MNRRNDEIRRLYAAAEWQPPEETPQPPTAPPELPEEPKEAPEPRPPEVPSEPAHPDELPKNPPGGMGASERSRTIFRIPVRSFGTALGRR